MSESRAHRRRSAARPAPAGRGAGAGSTIERAPLRSAVRRRLLDAMLRGDPGPGASLNEVALATDLGISRTPLREALLALEEQGFVHTDPGRGFFVVPLTLREAQEIYPMLWTLEGLALRSAGRPPSGQLAVLTRLNRELAAAHANADRALSLDGRWHEVLIERCDNQRLLDLVATLKHRVFRYEVAFMRDSGRIISSVEQHARIIADLRAGRLEAAARHLERNWRVSLEFLEPWLSGAGRPAPTLSRTRSARRRRETP
jgi:DNA-binding GntR family transcriptional regulator